MGTLAHPSTVATTLHAQPQHGSGHSSVPAVTRWLRGLAAVGALLQQPYHIVAAGGMLSHTRSLLVLCLLAAIVWVEQGCAVTMAYQHLNLYNTVSKQVWHRRQLQLRWVGIVLELVTWSVLVSTRLCIAEHVDYW